MALHRRVRHPAFALTVVGTVLLAGLLVSSRGSAEPNPCPSTNLANLYLSQTATQSSVLSYTLTVTNAGPCSGTGVFITDTLPFPPADPVCISVLRSWSCSVAGQVVTATLTSAIPASATAVVAINATLGVNGINRATVSNTVEGDTDLSDNSVDGGFATSVSTIPGSGSHQQQLGVTIPNAASIAVRQVNSRSQGNSPLAAATPAPCETGGPGSTNICLTDQEILVDTSDIPLSQWPAQHITLSITTYAPGFKPTNFIVYRYHNDTNWVLLPNLRDARKFTGDPNDGFVNLSESSCNSKTGFCTIVVWTTHNGHAR